MKCLYCGKDGCPDEWVYCNECGTDMKQYEKATTFINNGLELEKQLKYARAAEELRKALEFNIPKDKILAHLERIVSREEVVIQDMELGAEFFKKKKWGKAIKMYEKVLKEAPYFEKDLTPNVMKARAMFKKTIRLRWIICVIAGILVIAGGVLLYMWSSSPEQVALKTLKEGITSADASNQQTAIEIIGRLQDKRLAPLVREKLKDNDAIVRASAAKALGDLKDSASISFLKECLSDKDWQVRNEAAKSLATMGDAAGTEYLKKALK